MDDDISDSIRLRQLNLNLEAHLSDHRLSIVNIQLKYQEALNERGQFEHEARLAAVRADSLEKRIDTQAAEYAKLKEQNEALQVELATARAAMKDSVVPGVADMEILREENRTLQTDIQRLQKRIANNNNDLEYMRNNYHTASSAAATVTSELNEARVEMEKLRAKASSNRVEIHRIQQESEAAALLNQNRSLTVMIEELKREVEKKDAEMAAVMNGRRPTRGTSVPRSPRSKNYLSSPEKKSAVLSSARQQLLSQLLSSRD